ncbi:bifunctional riboflavin kinase/FAD synthetase [Propionibacterium australiense]|uniref:Riboflavin biosynthesis protein n=1 Tax=Propionibacterium australiense TaxID=119981 RepID=A0A383S8W2_9ACTN|nr:bifunctional riboflavin kinase/FAD synthetase [Propionibacterium australiense]RLP11066.1 bifunctional riboflavin kinase/FAD synthetase [Propionibacterium australiense]RLP12390.1 bifunctional riboflavin kinase/FAD synthetase [Propionibacterium australiense]SYZ33992.1 riboflavin kinase/FAD synthetase [Propionibacterium australiense]VEH91312.1 Riboflavin biosynthesis protein ribF [Propionibacterium australiense]
MAGSVVVIGTFDGVHRGHQALLEHARERAAALGGAAPLPVIAVTLWPHPMTVFASDRVPRLLTTLEDRIELLKRYGAAQVRVVQFNGEVAAWSPARFVGRIIDPLDPRLVIVGANFTFGKGAAGDPRTLAELGAGRFETTALDLVGVGGVDISSSRIRKALAAGDISGAAERLGRWFSLTGVVVVGDQRGRLLGFPTANLPVPAELATPGDGVYAGWVRRADEPDAEVMPAAISVGTNPTFDGVERRVESYVLDHTDLELYGARIRVEFVKQLRGQMRFSGVDELVVQMRHDVAQTRQLLADSANAPTA